MRLVSAANSTERSEEFRQPIKARLSTTMTTKHATGTQTHDQSNQVKCKKGGYTPEYEKRARTASKMSQNLEIRCSDHLNVG
jgi:hypothetical protein